MNVITLRKVAQLGHSQDLQHFMKYWVYISVNSCIFSLQSIICQFKLNHAESVYGFYWCGVNDSLTANLDHL